MNHGELQNTGRVYNSLNCWIAQKGIQFGQQGITSGLNLGHEVTDFTSFITPRKISSTVR